MTPELFTVIQSECIACGAPESVAPDLMEQHGDSQDWTHCRFLRQPETAAELDQAIAAVNASCCGAVVYTGDDPYVLDRIGTFTPWIEGPNRWLGTITIPDTTVRRDFGQLRVAHAIMGIAGVACLALVIYLALFVHQITTAGLMGWLMLLSGAIGLLRGWGRS